MEAKTTKREYYKVMVTKGKHKGQYYFAEFKTLLAAKRKLGPLANQMLLGKHQLGIVLITETKTELIVEL